MADTESDAATREYAPFAGHFVVTVDEEKVGSFQEVSGLGAEVDVEELTEGGNNRHVHKLPGRITWPNIVLKRGVIRSDLLFRWFATASEHGLAPAEEGSRPSGTLSRREVAIEIRDHAGDTVRSWGLTGAFPVRWTGPTLAATASDIAVEELELAHHGFRSAS